MRDMMQVCRRIFCKAYLCLCINHWCDRLRIHEPVCGKCRSDGGIVNRGGADPISGCALSLEFTPDCLHVKNRMTEIEIKGRKPREYPRGFLPFRIFIMSGKLI